MAVHVTTPSSQWRPFHMALVAVAALTTFAWLVNPPAYFTNDDATIRLMLEGRAVPEQPSTGFALNTHSVLGWSIVAAHRFLPAVPWWDLIVTGTLVWALAVFFSVAWPSLGRSWLARVTAVGALLVVATPLVSGLQFTIAATLAGGAAVSAAAIELGSTAPPRRFVLAMSGALLVLGLLVRPIGATAGAFAVGLLFVPLSVASALPTKRLVITLVVVMGLCAAVQCVDILLRKLDKQWDDYHQYNSIVVRFVEWSDELSASDTDAIRAAVGWSSPSFGHVSQSALVAALPPAAGRSSSDHDWME